MFGCAGRTRIRCAEGWVSEITGTGRVLFELVNGSELGAGYSNFGPAKKAMFELL